MNNPLQMLAMIRNPKEMVMNMAKQNSNPIMINLIDMANKNDIEGIENFGRNFLKSQGRDYDKEVAELKKILGKK